MNYNPQSYPLQSYANQVAFYRNWRSPRLFIRKILHQGWNDEIYKHNSSFNPPIIPVSVLDFYKQVVTLFAVRDQVINDELYMDLLKQAMEDSSLRQYRAIDFISLYRSALLYPGLLKPPYVSAFAETPQNSLWFLASVCRFMDQYGKIQELKIRGTEGSMVCIAGKPFKVNSSYYGPLFCVHVWFCSPFYMLARLRDTFLSFPMSSWMDVLGWLPPAQNPDGATEEQWKAPGWKSIDSASYWVIRKTLGTYLLPVVALDDAIGTVEKFEHYPSPIEFSKRETIDYQTMEYFDYDEFDNLRQFEKSILDCFGIDHH